MYLVTMDRSVPQTLLFVVAENLEDVRAAFPRAVWIGEVKGAEPEPDAYIRRGP